MKNWLPLVFAHALAIDNAPVKFVSFGENSSSNSHQKKLSHQVPFHLGSHH
jgi:hypothetical protein